MGCSVSKIQKEIAERVDWTVDEFNKLDPEVQPFITQRSEYQNAKTSFLLNGCENSRETLEKLLEIGRELPRCDNRLLWSDVIQLMMSGNTFDIAKQKAQSAFDAYVSQVSDLPAPPNHQTI